MDLLWLGDGGRAGGSARLTALLGADVRKPTCHTCQFSVSISLIKFTIVRFVFKE